MEQMIRGIPVVGFEIGAGQFEVFDEDGVATGPIVGLTLIERDGEQHVYTLHPGGAKVMAQTLEDASAMSLKKYFPKLAQRERRARRRAVAFLALYLVLYASFVGWSMAGPQPVRGFSLGLGILGGFEALVQMFGTVAAILWVFTWGRRRRSYTKLPPE